jgi:hypothetical protein
METAAKNWTHGHANTPAKASVGTDHSSGAAPAARGGVNVSKIVTSMRHFTRDGSKNAAALSNFTWPLSKNEADRAVCSEQTLE